MVRSSRFSSKLASILIAIVAVLAGIQLASNSGDESPTATSSSTAKTFSPHGEDVAASGDEIDGWVSTISDPQQADAVAAVLRKIESGASLPYDQDGGVFGNREGNLPDLPSGEEYHEYTVPTPGSPDRGARRLVISSTGLVYYTADHYDTFTLLNG